MTANKNIKFRFKTDFQNTLGTPTMLKNQEHTLTN
jgi:hypothetical protein